MHVSAPLGTRSPASEASIFPTGRLLPFALVVAVFFLWGMSNNLTDILVQQFRKSFELNLLRAQLVQTAVFLAYGIMAIPAALLTRRFGYKNGILIGLCVFGTGTLLFWPAAVIGQYTPFLIALFAVGCGSSILETAANPFIAQFGDPETSERRLNFAQAFNPPGTIAGVFLGTTFIFSGIEKTPAQVAAMRASGEYAAYLHTEITRVVPTYVGLGIVVLLLAFLIHRTRFPSSQQSSIDGPDTADGGSFAALFHYSHLLLAVCAQFAYVGAQVGIWSTFIPYLKAYAPVTEKQAGYLLIGHLIAFAAGRIVSTPLMRFIPPARMAGFYAVFNVALLLFSITHPSLLGGYIMIASSFFMSVMYPTIFALGIKGLGPHTKLGGSFLVLAILSGAIFPPLMGVIARATDSIAAGYWLPLASFIVVALYGLAVPHTRVSTQPTTP